MKGKETNPQTTTTTTDPMQINIHTTLYPPELYESLDEADKLRLRYRLLFFSAPDTGFASYSRRAHSATRVHVVQHGSIGGTAAAAAATWVETQSHGHDYDDDDVHGAGRESIVALSRVWVGGGTANSSGHKQSKEEGCEKEKID